MTIMQISEYLMPALSSYPINKTKWKIDIKRSVLLIHDMQYYFLRYYEPNSALIKKLINNLENMRKWANNNNIPVVYTAQPHNQPAEDRALLNDFWGSGLTATDEAQQLIINALTPSASDTVLTKWRYSAFQRTKLLECMKNWNRNQLIIGGIYAHIGCMVTSIDAFMNDIQSFLIGDAVADFSEEEHRLALNYVATRCGHVIDTESIIELTSNKSIHNWLQENIIGYLEEVTELDPKENLILYGLDSLKIMQIAAGLKDRGIHISFEELARNPSLESWCNMIDKVKT